MSKIPPNLTLEDEKQAFYAALGKSIVQWQAVEENLALVFSGAINTKPDGVMVANAAFYSIISFRAKLGMVESALATSDWTSTFSRPAGEESPVYAEWKRLKESLKKRNGRRNELAHFAMQVDEAKKPGHRCVLMPNIMDTNALMRHGGDPPTRNARVISAYGEAFQKLAMQLLLFYRQWLVG